MEIEAPQDLEAGYELDAKLRKSTVTIVVPEGGIAKGGRLLFPKISGRVVLYSSDDSNSSFTFGPEDLLDDSRDAA